MQTKEKQLWISSDTHFNHKNIIKYGRPEDFEEQIKDGLKDISGNDILIHLGDVCIGKDAENNEYLSNIKGKHILVKGNHDNKSTNFYLKY
jgi:calcineurin-like phosphoesterase family protein